MDGGRPLVLVLFRNRWETHLLEPSHLTVILPTLRYVLFDGDVDALWVEDMNSVMDDNKLLTLANGERIRLQAHCALLFEVGDLQYASPATVSRAGQYVQVIHIGCFPPTRILTQVSQPLVHSFFRKDCWPLLTTLLLLRGIWLHA